ncbi:MAG TPA: hypothetical protein VK638_31530, partial [Edaphobacter sp.]|nr:hypothetical protein [Edaphobacter sp.]
MRSPFFASGERAHPNGLARLCLFSDGVLQGAAETLETDFGNIALFEDDAITEGECVGSVEVDVDAAGLTVAGELEVVMFEVSEAVTHIVLAAGDGLAPKSLTSARDTDLAGDIAEGCADHELGTEAAGAKLGTGEVE